MIETLKQLIQAISKDGARTVIVIVLTISAWSWVIGKFRTAELALMNRETAIINKLSEQSTQFKTLIDQLNERIFRIETKLDNAWTIHMMAARDRIFAEKNTNIYTPDSIRIYYDVREGRSPVGLRVLP